MINSILIITSATILSKFVLTAPYAVISTPVQPKIYTTGIKGIEYKYDAMGKVLSYEQEYVQEDGDLINSVSTNTYDSMLAATPGLPIEYWGSNDVCQQLTCGIYNAGNPLRTTYGIPVQASSNLDCTQTPVGDSCGLTGTAESHSTSWSQSIAVGVGFSFFTSTYTLTWTEEVSSSLTQSVNGIGGEITCMLATPINLVGEFDCTVKGFVADTNGGPINRAFYCDSRPSNTVTAPYGGPDGIQAFEYSPGTQAAGQCV